MILKYIKENSLKILFIIFILFYILIYVANDEKRGTLTSVTDHNVYLSNNCANFENIFDKKIDVCRDNIKELELFFPGVIALYRAFKFENIKDQKILNNYKYKKILKKKNQNNFSNTYLLNRLLHDKTSYKTQNAFYRYHLSRDKSKLDHSIYFEFLTDFKTIKDYKSLLIKGVEINNIYDYSIELNNKTINLEKKLFFKNKGLHNLIDINSNVTNYCIDKLCNGKTILRLFANINLASDENNIAYVFNNEETLDNSEIIYKDINQNEFYEAYIGYEEFNNLLDKSIKNNNNYLIQFSPNKDVAAKIVNKNNVNLIQILLISLLIVFIILNKNSNLIKSKNFIFLLIIYLFWSLNIFENNFIMFELSIINVLVFLILLLLNKRLNLILLIFIFSYLTIILLDINIAYVTNLYLIFFLEIFYLKFIFKSQKT